MQAPRSWTEILHARAARAPEGVAFGWLDEQGEITRALGWGELERRSAAVAKALQARLRPGERAALVFPSGLDFVVALLGALRAGVVAVPAPLPDAGRPARSVARLGAVVADAAPGLILGRGEDLPALGGWLPGLPLLDIEQVGAARGSAPEVGPEALALLQYTSGSTGAPRGVALDHANLLHGCASIQHCGGHTTRSVSLCWAPHLHDYGLVEGLLTPIFVGCTALLMPPARFVASPRRWLEAITRHRVTHSGGPNFAYDLCVRRVPPEARGGLDLSSWRVALNAAEPIRPETLRRFAEAFGPWGFDPGAWQPAYGLAEATLQVSNRLGAQIRTFSAEALARGRAEPARDAGDRAVELPSCGRPALGVRVHIVEPERGEAREDGAVGEIWVAGPGVARGYHGQDGTGTFGARTRDGEGPWLRTGDLGFVLDGELYVTGRRKDLIVLHGQKHHPQDVEWVLDDLAAQGLSLRVGASAAFAEAVDGVERLVIVAEVEAGAPIEGLPARICAEVAGRLEIQPGRVVLVEPAQVPRTTSGKRARGATAEALARGGLKVRLDWGAGPGVSAERARDPSLARVLAALAAQLGAPVMALDPDQPFATLGLDSVRGVQLLAGLDPGASPALLWEAPTPRALARRLDGGPPPLPSPQARPSAEPIAIVGLACRLPGANGPEALWDLLREGRDAVAEIPPERWPATPPGVPRQAGLLPQIDAFDAGRWGLGPREARAMDPQHRLLLELTWAALEHAGIAPDGLQGADAGVYVGISGGEYRALDPALDGPAATGNLQSLAAGRIAWHLGLRGAALSVDTACSSSLVAVHLACRALRAGEHGLALVGGVNLLISPEASVMGAALGALSPTGRCRAFDDAADGYVRAEGGAVVVLQPLSAARAAGRRILAVIAGTAINHDGRSNGLTAPSGQAQREVIGAALADSGLAPSAVGLVEAHGTGTPLGDPVELRALGEAYGPGRAADRPLAVGSIKSNLGHLEAAAGLAGLVKAVLCLQHGQIPASLHHDIPNRHVGWATLPLRVVRSLEPWAGPRAAGVSSFGLSGTNAHVVLVEAPPEPPILPASEELPLWLSAGSEGANRRLAGALAEALTGPDAPDMADAAWTLAIGRARLACCAAVHATTREEALAGLRALAEGRPHPGVVHGAERPRPTRPRRVVSLPGAPFEREPLWHPPSGGLAGSPVQVPSDTLHQRVPLDLRALPWLDDHWIAGARVVPGALHLVVLLAVARARLGLEAVGLRDVRFPRPLALTHPTELAVALRPTSGGWEAKICTAEGGGWRTHAEARVVPGVALAGRAPAPPAGPGRSLAPMFQALAEAGVGWRPGWRRTDTAWLDGDTVQVRLDAHGAPISPVHPILLDNALGLALAGELLEGPGWGAAPFLPWAVDALDWVGEAEGPVGCVATLRARTGETRTCDLAIYAGERQVGAVSGLVFKRAGEAPVTAASGPSPAPTARAAAADLDRVRRVLAEVLGLEGPDAVPPERPLKELGLDSILAVELRLALAEATGLELPATLAFDHPTAAALASHLAGLQRPMPAPAPARAPAGEPVAIIGMACRFPGGLDTPERYWQALLDGRELSGEIPASRFDLRPYLSQELGRPGTTCTSRAALLDEDLHTFDADFFGVRAREARRMDPQQRLLLEVVWEALERAGLAPDRLAGSRTGLFLALAATDHVHHQRETAGETWIDGFAVTGALPSAAAGRISYLLGLQGPCLVVDTACSSVLTALHLARQSLRTGECERAIVAGANLILSPLAMLYFSQLGALSPTGRCRPFDAEADGYVRGEGAGALVLERAAALAPGRRIEALVLGTATGQDGRSNGLVSPSGPGQERVIRAALADAGLGPEDLGYVEAAGTGTPLGDGVEAGALGAVFGGRTTALPIGSVKGGLGHLEAASGLASLMKAALAMRHGELPPTVNLERPSPLIAWEKLGIRVPTTREPWQGPGRAGVSGFGFAGSNAHAILAAPPEPAAAATEERPWHLLTLSADSPARLKVAAGRLAEHLELHPEQALADVCYTANTGRALRPWRLAAVAAQATDLARQLTSFAEDRFIEKIYVNQPRIDPRAAPRPAAGLCPPPDRWALPPSAEPWAALLTHLGLRVASGPEADLLLPLSGPDPWSALLDGLARAFAAGARLDLAALDAPWSRRVVLIPTTAWARQRLA